MKILFSLWLSAILIFPVQAQDNDEASSAGEKLIGIWQPSDGRSYLKIERIGNIYFGHVVWLKEPNDENGNPGVARAL